MRYSTCCGAETDMEEVGICPECLEHCDWEEDIESHIEELNLTEKQVLYIVMEWYTNGMCKEKFQNENGIDLEEFCEHKLIEKEFQPIDQKELLKDLETENQIEQEQLNKK